MVDLHSLSSIQNKYSAFEKLTWSIVLEDVHGENIIFGMEYIIDSTVVATW